MKQLHLSALSLGITAIVGVAGILYYRSASAQQASQSAGGVSPYPLFQSAALPSYGTSGTPSNATPASATPAIDTGALASIVSAATQAQTDQAAINASAGLFGQAVQSGASNITGAFGVNNGQTTFSLQDNGPGSQALSQLQQQIDALSTQQGNITSQLGSVIGTVQNQQSTLGTIVGQQSSYNYTVANDVNQLVTASNKSLGWFTSPGQTALIPLPTFH